MVKQTLPEPDAMSRTPPEPELDPDRIDRLLYELEQELEKMPSDNPTTRELRMEIETLRAMVELRNTKHGWNSEQHDSIRRSLQNIIERLRGDALREHAPFVKIRRLFGLD